MVRLRRMTCALCDATDAASFLVPPARTPPDRAPLCAACRDQVTGAAPFTTDRWATLRQSVWSEDPAVQVLSWRVLDRLARSEAWARELLEQVWLDDELAAWARAAPIAEAEAPAELRVVDAHGAPLAEGDSVTLIKDLDVKGAGFTAKRGTLVKGIHLTDDAGLVEGRVNGMAIVLKTEFLKRA
jgi:protein PhnA